MLTEMWSFKGRYKILHMTWFAFFLTFVVWFNLAPLATTIRQEFGFEVGQIRTIAICNVALTVPARVIIGMLLDRFGPRKTFTVLLIYAAIPCLLFATAQNFSSLVISRLLLSIVGAGFVIGIRMVAEWFPPKEIGLAEGIYGGWGNFGSAASAFTLPTVAAWLAFGAVNPATGDAMLNWRWSIALTGIITALYGIVYYFNVEDTPPGKTYQKPNRHGGLEVTSQWDFWFLLFMNIPLNGILAVLAWRLSNVGFLTQTQLYVVWACLLGLYSFQTYNCWIANSDLMSNKRVYNSEDRYDFSQVALLELTYIANFGSELAVVSMLPSFFENTFGLSAQAAGMIASSYAFMNLASRPGGGLISDKLGSRKWTMAVLLAGMGVGYLLMGGVTSGWLLPLAVILTMACSFFVQAAEGSTFAMVPLIKRRVTGQVAGNVGAYGNVGAVAYLTTYSLLPEGAVGNRTFFFVLGGVGLLVALLCAIFLKEPKGSFAEFHEGEMETLEVGGISPLESMS